MRVPTFFLLSAILFPIPLLAQPPVDPGGPWAADADGDGRITRDEMQAWLDRRFSAMDSRGEGAVPVEAMQQLLGHQRARADAGEDRQSGRSGRGGPKGMGPAGPPPGGGPGGPPPSGQYAGADAPPPPGRTMPYPEDSNDDGMIDRAEFSAPALAMFADQDRNGDNMLSGDEMPPPPPPLRQD